MTRGQNLAEIKAIWASLKKARLQVRRGGEQLAKKPPQSITRI